MVEDTTVTPEVSIETEQTFIPRIIHLTWKNAEIPDKWKNSFDSWKALESDGFQVILWTDIDLRTLIAEKFGWFLEQYDSYPQNIMRVDAARVFMLYEFGGIYSDLDLICKRDNFLPFYEMIKTKEVAISSTKAGNGVGGLGFTNAFMASKRGAKFWEHVMDWLKDPIKGSWWKSLAVKFPYFQPLVRTGPIMISESVNSYPFREEVFMIPAQLSAPGNNRSTYKEGPVETPESVLAVTEGSSWHYGWSPKVFKTAGDVINVWPFIVLGLMILFLVLCIFFWWLFTQCRNSWKKPKMAKSYQGKVRVV